MEQKQIIEAFRKADYDPAFDYPKAGVYFKRAYEFYRRFQQGTASELNFFDYTITIFSECEEPQREPDFTSASGSRYWYSSEGVIRGANHWGNGLDNCDWAYRYHDGRMIYGHGFSYFRWFRKQMFGFSPWKDFVLKPRIFTIEGQEVITTFDNFIAREMIKVNGRILKRTQRVTDDWQEISQP